jgi:predicted MPP superfamily phosphohydrolase
LLRDVLFEKERASRLLRSYSRRVFLKTAIASGALAATADCLLFEPNRPQLVRVEIPLARLPEVWDGVTIAQLSDFHYDDHFSVVPIRKAVDIVNGLRPGFIVLTGDFVTVPLFKNYFGGGKRAARFIEPCAPLLAKLRPRRAVLAILGNHDCGSDPGRITETLQAHGIQVLRNRSWPFEEAGKPLWFAGLDDVLEGEPDLDATLRQIPKSEPIILLAHEPDYADAVAQHAVDLQLSGHSHGGQIRFPLIGAPYLPRLATKYPRGLHRIRELTLYTNVGIGTIRLPVRFNCPPEITLFTLRRASPSG